MSGDTQTFMMGLLCGAAVGAAVGLLLAPKSGHELRSMLSDSASKVSQRAGETYRKTKQRAQDAYQKTTERKDELMNSARSMAQSGREQLELLSLMQLVTGDLEVPAAGTYERPRHALPAQMIGDGTILPVEIRSVAAGAVIVSCAGVVPAGAQVVLRAADAVTGIRATRMGRRVAGIEVVPVKDPVGRPYLWIGDFTSDESAGHGTDLEATMHGAISVTPLHVDLTHGPTMRGLAAVIE